MLLSAFLVDDFAILLVWSLFQYHSMRFQDKNKFIILQNLCFLYEPLQWPKIRKVFSGCSLISKSLTYQVILLEISGLLTCWRRYLARLIGRGSKHYNGNLQKKMKNEKGSRNPCTPSLTLNMTNLMWDKFLVFSTNCDR